MKTSPQKFLPRAATLVAVLFSLTAPAHAQELPPLRWGTDPTGGAPFNYRDAAGTPLGFEYELAGYLAAKLGRTPVMVEGDWSKLPAICMPRACRPFATRSCRRPHRVYWQRSS